jgi:hypothetical protein
MTRSGLRWLCLTVAPWGLAAGLVVSFTAVASNDPKAGVGGSPAYLHQRTLDEPLIAAPHRSAEPSPHLPRLDFAGLVADRSTGLPRFQGKEHGGDAPLVMRARKGGPANARASLSRRGLELAQARIAVADRLAFAHDIRVLPPTILMRGPVDGPDWDTSRGLEPWAGEDPTTTRNTSSVQSPAAAAAGSTGAARGPSRLSGDGATPATGRAVALASMTPAPADARPVQVAAAPVSFPTRVSPLPIPAEPEPRSHYTELFAGPDGAREQRCLAEAVYFEARSEPEEGRAAVAQVVLNRARSGLYPSTVCGVVYQNRHRHLACQFTFACEGKALRITETEAWESAKRIARDVSEGRTYLAEVGGSTHYHADYVKPYWAKRLKRMDVIGRHIFYQLRPGQT